MPGASTEAISKWARETWRASNTGEKTWQEWCKEQKSDVIPRLGWKELRDLTLEYKKNHDDRPELFITPEQRARFEMKKGGNINKEPLKDLKQPEPPRQEIIHDRRHSLAHISLTLQPVATHGPTTPADQPKQRRNSLP